MIGKKNKIILIVDDDLELVNFLKYSLKSKKYDVLISSNGTEAIATTLNHFPDLILLDIKMPEIDGYQVCRRLKTEKKTRDIPIIFMSVLMEEKATLRAFEIGGVDYIKKPILQEELQSRIKIHLMLYEQRQRMQSAISIRDKLFSIVSHDLRNSFSGLELGLQICINDNIVLDEEKRKQMLKSMYQNEQKIKALLENLLFWAKNQQNSIDFKLEKIDISRIIEIIFQLENLNSSEKSIQLISNVNQPLYVKADRNIILLIFRNLISNAIKFSHRKGRVTVSAVKKASMVEMTILDNGVGVMADGEDRLFRSSGLYSTYGTENEKGIGIGLSLCNEFIALHGGKIWVESKQGEGATFSFTLPEYTESEEEPHIENTDKENNLRQKFFQPR